MRSLALGAIRLYQIAISPYSRGTCRYMPPCSSYAYEAVSKHGVAKGIWLGVRRVSRCRPMGASGYDPVP